MKKVLLLIPMLALAVSCTVTVPVTATSNPVGTKPERQQLTVCWACGFNKTHLLLPLHVMGDHKNFYCGYDYSQRDFCEED